MNDWCAILGIQPPDLAEVKDHREAIAYSLLIVALLERGEAMTLDEVALRFEEVGIAPAARARKSLARCKPGRAPVYRDGDLYSLDPHDDEAGLWAFRLGLRPPRVPSLRVVRPEPPPLPGPDQVVTTDELREAFDGSHLRSWSNQRLALAVLEACGRAMKPSDVVAFVDGLTRWHSLHADGVVAGRRGCPITLDENGLWGLDDSIATHLVGMRKAVRALVSKVRQGGSQRQDPEVVAALLKAAERRSEAKRVELAALERCLLVAFPPAAPRAVALVDIRARTVETFVDQELEVLLQRLDGFGLIGALGIRPLLQALGFDPGARRLAELGPPQKTKKLNKRGRTLKITPELLIAGSCGISRPFGDPEKLGKYLSEGQTTRLRRRLESDVKALQGLYSYGRLHGAVRLRWGFLDEMLPAPWSNWDEEKLYGLMKSASELGVSLEVVVGNAPGWADPWARGLAVEVWRDPSGWRLDLVDPSGEVIDERDVQAARLAR